MKITWDMRKLKLISTFILAVMAAPAVSVAQSGKMSKPAEERARLLTDQMTATLKLDAGQQEKVAEINLKYAKKMDPVIKGSGSKLSRFKAYKSISDEKNGELKSVLSDEQFAQYSKQQEKMKDQLKERKRP